MIWIETKMALNSNADTGSMEGQGHVDKAPCLFVARAFVAGLVWANQGTLSGSNTARERGLGSVDLLWCQLHGNFPQQMGV